MLIPAVFMFVAKSDPIVKPGTVPKFRLHASLWGLAAGMAGAMGVVCNLRRNKGWTRSCDLCGGAPIINTLATIYYFHPTKTLPDWRFLAGLILAVVGASLVLIYKPVDKPHGPALSAANTSPVELHRAVEH